MKVKTRDFGEIEIDEQEIITFRQPIFGFETMTRYIFLYDEALGEQFVWLQSLEERDICFILVDPAVAMPDYSPELPRNAANLLGDEDYMCWLVAVIPEEFHRATVNLKSPIVVNHRRKCAAQVILEEDLPIRFPLFPEGRERSAC